MNTSNIFEDENDERLDYLEEWFTNALNLEIGDSLTTIQEKISELKNKDFNDLTQTQTDFINYYSGEKNKQDIKNFLHDRLKEKGLDFDKFDYQQIDNKSYEQSKEILVSGDRQFKAHVEKTFQNGQLSFRFRDINTGRFVSSKKFQ